MTHQPPALRALAVAMALASFGHAVQAQVVLPPPAEAPIDAADKAITTLSDIRIEGLRRIEPGTVFSYLPVKSGDAINQTLLAESIRRLFATGFFNDVQAKLEGSVLVVTVDERPAIGNIEITGAKEFEVDVLKNALADTGLAEARIFDRSLLERAEAELKRQYLGRGKYDVEIKSTVTPLERNRVALNIAIDEGDDASISEIRIVGAQAFRERELLRELQLSPPNYLSWYTNNDQYSRQKLTQDLETLRNFYLNRGYLEFAIDSTQVQLSPDRKKVFITIVVREGDKFTFGKTVLRGELLGADEELQKKVVLKEGRVFSNQDLQDVVKSLTDRLGELGYAFATVTPVPTINRETKAVDFTLRVEPGRRVYVRRINIAGNTKTRDEVIRRELRQFEASFYDAERIRLSRNRIDRLGYFKNVSLEPNPVPGVPDQVDLDLKVEELPLGSVSLGLGFSSSESIVLSGSVSQQNFLGTGTAVSVELNTSEVNRTAAFRYTDPYYTDDGVSRSFELYSRLFNAGALNNLDDYRVLTQGGALRFGFPYTETTRLFAGVGLENTQLDLEPTSPIQLVQEQQAFGRNSTAYLATAGLSRDTRDSAIAPSSGTLQSLNVEYATPIGEREYVRATYTHSYFQPITRSITFAIRGDFGYGVGLGGKNFPLTKNFFAGGIGSVRGFAPSSIGPRFPDQNGRIGGRQGGNRRIVFNNELLFPFPGAGNDRTLRLFTFFDAGTVYAENQDLDLSQLRYSYGFGLSWLSPVGPLKLSFGQALRRSLDDDTQRFQFQIGTTF